MVIELFATFDFWRIDKTLVNSNQKNDTLFHKKMFFFLCIKEFWIAFPVKYFLKE